MAQSRWFKRLKKEVQNMEPHIKFVRIKYGFYRIYWCGGGNSAYLYEVYEDMPAKGYMIYDKDIRLQDKKYYEEWEDQVEYTQKLKNFVEGYYDAIRDIKTRMYMFRNNKEFRDRAREAYSLFHVK